MTSPVSELERKIRLLLLDVNYHWVSQVVNEALGCNSLESIPKWEQAEPLPETMDCEFTDIITPIRDDLSYTEWVIWTKEGDVEILKPTQSIGWSNANIHQEPKLELYLPDKMPVGVTKAVKVTHGFYRNLSTMDGVCINLYKAYC